MPEKLAVWDWNCTLLNDFKYINEAANFILYYFGYGHVSMNEHRERRVKGVANVLIESGMPIEFLNENMELVIQRYYDYLEYLSKDANLRWGAKKTLNQSTEKGYSNIIVSNHSINEITPHISRLNVPIYRGEIYANGNHHNKPPKETLFLNAIGGRNVDFKNSFIVGDSLDEVELGKKYGMKTFWIAGGDYNYKDVAKYNPIPITNLTQIINILGAQ